ncbi:glycosyltransferase family protein [Salix suchowensis]|nr:glycosyltransferase family protein [Salix suchowensis]
MQGERPKIPGLPSSAWAFTATLENVPDGVLTINLNNPAVQGGNQTTGAIDHLMLRKGLADNVVVFPRNEYDRSSFSLSDGKYVFEHKAFGADMFRYSWNLGRIGQLGRMGRQDYYRSRVTVVADLMVTRLEPCNLSTAAVVHADVGYSGYDRRVPQLLARGPFNNWGFDKGIPAEMIQNSDGKWELEIMASWPTYVQLNVWGYDDYYYGDTDGDGILDRLPPNTAAPNYLNMSAPPSPHLAWSLLVDDATMTWTLKPRGQASVGAIMYALLLSTPLFTGTLAVVLFMWTFYGVKYNQFGVKAKSQHSNYLPFSVPSETSPLPILRTQHPSLRSLWPQAKHGHHRMA